MANLIFLLQSLIHKTNNAPFSDLRRKALPPFFGFTTRDEKVFYLSVKQPAMEWLSEKPQGTLLLPNEPSHEKWTVSTRRNLIGWI